MIAKGR